MHPGDVESQMRALHGGNPMNQLPGRPRAFLFAIALILIFFTLPQKAQAIIPVVESIDPTEGYQGDVDLFMKIYGQDFELGALVFFENPGINVTGPVIVVNPTELQFSIDIAFGAPLGPGDVFVFNSPTEQDGLADAFTVLPSFAPDPQSIVPNQGYTGDTSIPVTITGAHLGFVTDVDFGAGITVDSVNVISDVQIDVVISIDWLTNPGPRDVTLFSPYGDTTVTGGFTVLKYDQPVILSVVPDKFCPGDSGVMLIVDGTGFLSGISFVFNPPLIDVITTQWLSDTQARLFVDVDSFATLGFYNLTCTNPDNQTGVLANAAEVIDCNVQIDDINPKQGTQGDVGLPVAIYGSGFASLISVDFGQGITVNINNFTDVIINVTLDIDIAAIVGFRDVTVATEIGDATLPNGFEVLELSQPPVIESVDPNSGDRGSITLPVTIYGQNLQNIDTVDFGPGITPSILNVQTDLINCALDIDPAAAVGFRDVTVLGPDIQDTLTNGFEVTQPTPDIIDCFPSQGEQDQTIDVIITGMYLDDIVSVDFGSDISVDTFSVISTDEIDATITIDPAALIGFRDIAVTDNQARFDTLVNGFEVTESPVIPPTLLSIDPNEGTQGDVGLVITVTGADFQDGITIDFNHPDIFVTQPSFVTPTSFDVTIDIDQAAYIGPTNVTVTNPDGGDDILIDAFTVLLAPVELTIDSIDPISGYPGDLLNFSLTGTGFQTGAVMEFLPDSAFFDINAFVITSSLIQGTINIHTDAPIGFQSVRVTNPDTNFAELFNAFEVLEITIPIEVDLIDPSSGYQGDILNFQIEGAGFETGATVEFLPDTGSFDISASVINSTVIAGTIIIDENAPAGFQTVRVTNPDSSFDELIDGFEVLQIPLTITSIDPASGYPGDTVDFEISGTGFKAGASVEFTPDSSFFDITANVITSSLIQGSVYIHEDATVGFQDVRVTNPDSQFVDLPNGFEVLEIIIPPPVPTEISPTDVCIGAVNEDFTIFGSGFQQGATVQFESGGVPTDAIYDIFVTFLDETRLDVVISVLETAEPGQYDIRVENPDLQFGYGPVLTVIDCATQGLLQWEDTILEAQFAYTEEFPGGIINEIVSANLLNVGETAVENVTLSMTDLVSSDGRAIVPENVEIYPSIIDMLPGLGSELININFVIPIDEEFLIAGGGVFTGNLIAKNTQTGDMALLPVSITITTPGGLIIEVDPLCLKVELHAPGVPSELLPEDFYNAIDGNASEFSEALGGCYDPFPLFEWGSFADGCPGYMETWAPSYKLTVYPIYPSQSAESAVTNAPVWTADGLTDTFIQYSLGAEPLDGFYMWQVEVIPVPIAGLGVNVAPIDPVISEIWAFCVDAKGAISEPTPIEGDIAWYPQGGTINACGMVPAALVLSPEAVADITAGTQASLSLSDPNGETLTIDLDLAGLQYSDMNPMPDFGPVAITFGINVTPNGFIGLGMLPGDLSIQIYNGGMMLGEIRLDDSSTGEFKLGAVIGGASADVFYKIIFPWDMGPCWDVWLEWRRLNSELEEACEDVASARDAASGALDDTENKRDDAGDRLLTALNDYSTALANESGAVGKYENDLQNCSDFFSNSIFADNVSFTDPGEGWDYVEAFGGAVRIWFNGNDGAALLNGFIDDNNDQYNDLWNNLKNATAAKDDASYWSDKAKNALDAASGAFNTASQNFKNAVEAYNVAMQDVTDCLENMRIIEESISNLKWQNPDCFGTTQSGDTASGLGVRGLEGGPGLPPINGDDFWPWEVPGGIMFEPGTGIGNGTEPCPCEDCDALYQALLDAEQALKDAKARLEELKGQLQEAQANLDKANADLATAMDTSELAGEIVDELEKKLNDSLLNGLDSEIDPTLHGDLAAAKEDQLNADQDLRDALFIQLLAEQMLAELKVKIGAAANDVLDATLARNNAENAYIGCIKKLKQCYEANGCGPFTPPDSTGGAGSSDADDAVPGGDTGDGSPFGPEVPRPPDAIGGDGGTPPGQGTGGATDGGGGSGTGEEECPCGDCLDAWNAYMEAMAAASEAGEAVNEAQQVLDEMEALLTQAQAALDGAKSAKASAESTMGGGYLRGPSMGDVLIAIMGSAIELGEAMVDLYTDMVANAQAMLDEATELWAQASIDALRAWNAYLECLKELEKCEQENDCPPSEPPGGENAEPPSIQEPPGE